jgi:hypothetical protein
LDCTIRHVRRRAVGSRILDVTTVTARARIATIPRVAIPVRDGLDVEA